jgi:ABC-type antimicrobial peptide transport system permease subunit
MTQMKQMSSPTPRKRAAYFVVGAVLGSILGYGLISAGPGPTPSILAPGARLWVFGGALICGALSALSPAAFWRQKPVSLAV